MLSFFNKLDNISIDIKINYDKLEYISVNYDKLEYISIDINYQKYFSVYHDNLEHI